MGPRFGSPNYVDQQHSHSRHKWRSWRPADHFFQRNDALHTDLTTNYGRLLDRLQRAGVAGAVRGSFLPGRSDNNDGAHHEAGFTALHSDWLEDYASLEHIYVFQLRDGDYVDHFNVDLRNRERLFADDFPNLSVLSTNGLDGHDGLHFHFTNGYETMGLDAARMLQRDLYNGASLPDTNAPNPAYAVLAGVNRDRIRIPLRDKSDNITFDAGAIADFAITGTSVSIISGGVVNGMLQLNLSGNASGVTSVVYTAHRGDGGQSITGNWVENAERHWIAFFHRAGGSRHHTAGYYAYRAKPHYGCSGFHLH